MKCFVITIALLLFCFSFGHTKQHNKSVSILNSSGGKFIAQLFLVSDEQEFIKQMEGLSENSQIKTITEVERGDVLATPIVFSGCYVNSIGNCNVVADIYLFKPNGSICFQAKDVKLWTERPSPPQEALALGEESLNIEIVAKYPSGIYTLEAIVTDKIKENSIKLIQKFTVIEKRKEAI